MMFRCLRRFSKLHMLLLLAMLLFVMFAVYQVHNIDEFAAADAASDPDHVHDAGGGGGRLERQLHANYNYDSSELVYYKKDIPLIWIGGVPRSGTTLMRAMLDAHTDIRCGEETRVIPRILGMHTGMQKSTVEMSRLLEAKIDESVLDQALAAYILSIIANHGEPAPRLCNKDPFTLRSMARLLKMFPQSRFILMLRDGRATAHSIISRHVTIKGFDIRTYRGALRDWNRAVGGMYGECVKHGASVCLPVHYEQLVLHPEAEMRRILEFLDVRWDDMVLHHEKTIGKDKGVSLSKKELSTDQVNKPINTGALTAWVDHIPEDVRRDIDEIAPMLQTLGYDAHAYPPDYGQPDSQVAANNKMINNNNKVKVESQVPDIGGQKKPKGGILL